MIPVPRSNSRLRIHMACEFTYLILLANYLVFLE